MGIDTRLQLTNTQALLRILFAGGPRQPIIRILQRFPDAISILQAGPPAWQQAGCTPSQCARLQLSDSKRVEETLRWLQQPQHHLIDWQSPDYPPLLRHLSNPPLALFVDGNPNLLWHPTIAIVGTRHPSPSGRDQAQRFASYLSDQGMTIVSGLALGIDGTAHQAALTCVHGTTIAVLGCGADIYYPRSHRHLHDQIASNGAIISEYPPGTPPLQAHFPARNRIIAGISLGTIVIEAAYRSGALITARFSAEAGHEVFALPGSVLNPMARGCHHLIRQGASLIEDPWEILESLGFLASHVAEALRARLGDTPQGIFTSPTGPKARHNRKQCLVWKALGFDPISLNDLVKRTGLTVEDLSSTLQIMELDGYVSIDHGRYYRRP